MATTLTQKLIGKAFCSYVDCSNQHGRQAESGARVKLYVAFRGLNTRGVICSECVKNIDNKEDYIFVPIYTLAKSIASGIRYQPAAKPTPATAPATSNGVHRAAA